MRLVILPLSPFWVVCATAWMAIGCTKRMLPRDATPPGSAGDVRFNEEGAATPGDAEAACAGAEPPRTDAVVDQSRSGLDSRIAAACAGRETPLKNSLAVSPRLLWSADIYSLGMKSQVAIAAGKVGVSTGATLSIYDRSGALKGIWKNPSNAQISVPTAGPDGHFYIAGDIAARVDGDGQEQWTVPLRRDDVFHGAAPNPLVLSPEGVLYSLQPDGDLQAMRATDGQPLWRKTIATSRRTQSLRIVGGIGSLLVVSGDPDRGYMVVDPKSGALLWEATRSETGSGEGLFAVSLLRGLGILVADRNGTGLRIGLWGWIADASPALERLWNLTVQRETVLGFQFIDHSGNMVFLEAGEPRGVGKPERLVTVGCDGQNVDQADLVPGPNAYFTGFALGADGLAYGLTLPGVDITAGVTLVVFDRSYRALRAHEFKDQDIGSQGGASLVISDDGILFLALQAKDGTGRIHALQTTSPGLAATARPTLRLDASGSNWAASR
jgi:hypothetical protein